MVGAKIRWADVDYRTGNICPESIEKISILVLKLFWLWTMRGCASRCQTHSANITEIQYPVIEDAAHAFGSKFEGKRAGNHFPFTVFSFQAIKHLTTVDGGALQIADEQLYEKGKLIRWFGLDKKLTRLDNDIQLQGYKYHMNNVNATIGLAQLEIIDEIVNKYIANGKYFDENLKRVTGVETLEYYENSEPSYWLYTL